MNQRTRCDFSKPTITLQPAKLTMEKPEQCVIDFVLVSLLLTLKNSVSIVELEQVTHLQAGTGRCKQQLKALKTKWSSTFSHIYFWQAIKVQIS